jgi:outer membrane receptor for ferrienterochelin and colicin
VSKEAIKMLEFTNRKNKNAAPEYAVWVKSRDELMNDPVLVVGQKSDMEKAFGNKISLSFLLYFFCNFLTRFFLAVLAILSSDS